MLIWGPIAYILLLVAALFYARKPPKTVPILINGLIPSLPGSESKTESGTTVLVFYAGEDPKDPESEVCRGYADDKGCIRTTIPLSSVGRAVEIRIRHSAYKFQEIRMNVPRCGLIYTAKMEKDGVYSGQVRGAPIDDLDSHHQGALSQADNYIYSPRSVLRTGVIPK